MELSVSSGQSQKVLMWKLSLGYYQNEKAAVWNSSFLNPFITAYSGRRKVLLPLSFQQTNSSWKDVRWSVIQASTKASASEPPLRRLNHVVEGFPKPCVQNFWGYRALTLWETCSTLGYLHEQKGLFLSPIWTCHILMYMYCFSLYHQVVNSLHLSTQYAGHRQKDTPKVPSKPSLLQVVTALSLRITSFCRCSSASRWVSAGLTPVW